MNLSGKEPKLQEGSDIPFHCDMCRHSHESAIPKGQGKGKDKGKGKSKSSTASASSSVSQVVQNDYTENVTGVPVSSRG